MGNGQQRAVCGQRRRSVIRIAIIVYAIAAFAPQLASAQSSAANRPPPRLQALHVFSGAADGANPVGGLISAPNGVLYGTTYNGGSSSTQCLGIGCGVVFQLLPPETRGENWAFSTIYTFQGGADGELPTSPLALEGSSGALFGTTFGDRTVLFGNVFRLAPCLPCVAGDGPLPQWTFENIYVFQGGADGSLIDASTPLVAARGRVFGITRDGGSSAACGASGCGTFFELTPPAAGQGSWTKSVLFSFPGGAGGSAPIATTGFDAGGSIYVATSDARGAVERLSPPASDSGTASASTWTETVLYRFAGGSDGFSPSSLVLGTQGEVFGIAGVRGGTGIAFELTPPAAGGNAWTKTTIQTFRQGGFYGNGGPTSLAGRADGSLVGARFGDFDFGAGAIFELTPPRDGEDRWRFVQPWNFNTMGGPSRNPENVVPGAFGGLYGVLEGGDSDFGAVFAVY